jgi:apolipoprotein D and lipocalin family protein
VKAFIQGFTIILVSAALSGCLGYPENITPVQPFELNKYLGKWYEIARLDHSFERNLKQVTAEYSIRDDGGVKVLNRGYSSKKNDWKQAVGKAYFVKDENTGYLKVSFFGPFYGSYVIFELDQENYQYAFISGPDNSYLWFLSRTPAVEADLLEYFFDKAHDLEYNTDEIIVVEHNGS